MASRTRLLATSAALGAGGVALGMSGLGPLVFASAAAPALLGAGGAALPGLWHLMQTIPPRPKIVDFPMIRLLFNLSSEDKQAASIPLWQRLVRLGAVSAAVIGLSEPQFEASNVIEPGKGPVLMVVDNSWDSTKNWNDIRGRMEEILKTARRQGRSVMILPTAPETAEGIKAGPLQSADEALNALPALKPHPWPSDRDGALKALKENKAAGEQGVSVVWFSNGQDDPRALEFIQTLDGIGTLSVYKNYPENAAHLLSLRSGDDLGVVIRRLTPGPAETVVVTASGNNGEILTQVEARFAEGDTKTEAVFDIPAELRRQIVKISLPGESHAGAAVLLDESWRKRSVGLLGADNNSPLEDSFFIKRAVSAYTDLHTGRVSEMLKSPLSAIIMTDDASLSEEDRAQLQDWVKKGGMLLRFAGPRLAARPQDSLTSLPLMPGEHHTEGGLSGSTGGSHLAPFNENSPLAGVNAPSGFSVETRLLPETNPGGADRNSEVWAEFGDGVPFISARHEGEGWVVLVHSMAGMEWSNLPLSDGFFLDMMKSLITRSKNASAPAAFGKALPPLSVLDAQGRLGAAARSDIRLTREAVQDGRVDPVSPPGFYGETAITKQAHNLYRAVKDYKAVALPGGTKEFAVQAKEDTPDFKAWLLALAILLLATDMSARIIQNRGHRPASRAPEPETP